MNVPCRIKSCELCVTSHQSIPEPPTLRYLLDKVIFVGVHVSTSFVSSFLEY